MKKDDESWQTYAKRLEEEILAHRQHTNIQAEPFSDDEEWILALVPRKSDSGKRNLLRLAFQRAYTRKIL